MLQGGNQSLFSSCLNKQAYQNLAKYISAVPADSAQLRRVALTLPPPARLDFRTGTDLPRTTHLALEKLLNACGVSYEFSGTRPWQLASQRSSLKHIRSKQDVSSSAVQCC